MLGDRGEEDDDSAGLYARVVVASVPKGWQDLTAATDTAETTRVYDFACSRPRGNSAFNFFGAPPPAILWRQSPRLNVRDGVNRWLMLMGLPPRF